jgi:hypothetical protein
LYGDPRAEMVIFYGAKGETRKGTMEGFEVRLIEVLLAPTAEGKPLTLEFHAPAAAGARFDVQIVHMMGRYERARPRHMLVTPAPTEVCTGDPQEGAWACAIPEIRTTAYDRLALIVTRLDGGERSGLTGEYTLTLRPGLDPH